MKTFYIKTFGCQQNVADSERMASHYEGRGYRHITDETQGKKADLVVINSCMIRERAEERVYGYIRNLRKERSSSEQHIILTGCITGAAAREPSGKLRKKLATRIPDVELVPLEEVGFEHPPKRARSDTKHAWVIISNGCNNYCTFCIVPFSRGREISRPFKDIIDEINVLIAEGYNSVTLLGQNVNSYGTDLVLAQKKEEQKIYTLPSGDEVEPVFVKHLGRHRIPTLFPYLLDAVAKTKGLETVTFTSANPWDYSDKLIEVIADNPNIDRLLHLPVQSGSDPILKAMNRWYTADEYLDLIDRLRASVPGVSFATDIIVGFPGETESDFQATIDLCKDAGFIKAFISQYSPRPGTTATGKMEDSISIEEKKRRWEILNDQVNIPNKGLSHKKDWMTTSTRKRKPKSTAAKEQVI